MTVLCFSEYLIMLERISDWFKQLPKCSRLDSPTELSEICSTIPLTKDNCFLPGQSKKVAKEKTELYLTWYAKDSFFECYHKRGSALLDNPWKSMVISPHVSNNTLCLIFVDMCTLQHKIFNLPDKNSWRTSCHIMFEDEYRPAKLFMKYKHPFNSRDFEFFAQSCGYVMCGWNSHKFLQKQIQYFKESYELVSKIKYILSHSSTVDYDLTLLQYFVSRNLTPEERPQCCETDQSESEEDIIEENLEIETSEASDNLSSNEDEYKTTSFENTRTDGTVRNRKLELSSSSSNSRKSKSKHSQSRNENIAKKDLTESKSKDLNTTMPLSSSMSHYFSENKRLKNAFLKSDFKNKINKNKTRSAQKCECILLDVTIKEQMFYFIFMDADSCYPQVMESESGDEDSCIESCVRFLERHPGTKEMHVPIGKPFDSERLKNYLEMQGIEYYFNSPLIQYLKQPRAAFSVLKRIISRNYSFEQRSKVLSEFVKKKIIMRNIHGRISHSVTDVSWKGRRVLAVEMSNDDGNFLLFVDLEKALVEAYPKKPKGRFIFPQELIVTFVEAFNELGIPKDLHTIGSNLFESPEFNRLIDYCRIKHCSDCWHAEQGTRHFKTLDHVKCCFERTSDVESGLRLWESLRKRLEICRRKEPSRMRKTCSNRLKKCHKGRGKKMNKYSKHDSDTHLLTYVVGQALWKVNDKKHKEMKTDDLVKKKETGGKNNLRDSAKRNKSRNLKLSVKKEKHLGRIDGAKYQKLLNKLLKRRETRYDSLKKTSNTSTKRKTRSNEKMKKNKSKRVSKYKKNCSLKLCGHY